MSFIKSFWPLALARQALVATGLVAFSVGASAQSIVVASTTSTEQSGLFGYLLPEFKKASGIDVKVVALGTGQALDTARRGDAATVRIEAQAIAALLADKAFKGPMADRQTGFAELFQKVLEGRAAMIDQDYPAAIAAYGRAAAIQAMAPEGGDPPMIWYPTRRSLAAAMLASGDAEGAKAKIGELLKDWPNDPYSYYVLYRAEQAHVGEIEHLTQ